MATPSPMAIALSKAGYISPQQAEVTNVNSAVSDAVKQLAETAVAEKNMQLLSNVINPKQPDPTDALEKTVKMIGSMSGIRSEEEKREEQRRREERERELREMQLAIEREKLELEKAKMEQMRQDGMMKMIMEQSNKQSDALAKVLQSMDERAEKREQQMREYLAKAQQPQKESELEAMVKQIGVQALTGPRPSPIKEIKDAQQLISALGLGQKGGMDQLEYDLRKQELEWKKEEAQRSRDVELQKVKNQGELLSGLTPMLLQFMQQKQGTTPGQATTEQPSARQTVDMAPVQCNCGHQMIVPRDTSQMKCEKCGEISIIDWGANA